MSEACIHQEYAVSGNNFASAGSASEEVKSTLKKLGVASSDIRRVAIAMYEGEINMVIHAGGGRAIVDIYLDRAEIVLEDHGKGIENVELAMTPGWSTAPEDIRALVAVKLADLADNMDMSRIKEPTEKDYKRLEKYKKLRRWISTAVYNKHVLLRFNLEPELAEFLSHYLVVNEYLVFLVVFSGEISRVLSVLVLSDIMENLIVC